MASPWSAVRCQRTWRGEEICSAMGMEGPEYASPTAASLAGTHISYTVERQVRLKNGIVELGRHHWDHPVELALRQPDDCFSLNLAVSPRPARGRICLPAPVEDDALHSIQRVVALAPGATFRLSVPAGQVRSLYCGIDRAGVEALVALPERAVAAGLSARLDGAVVELLLNRLYDELRDGHFASHQAMEAYVEALTVEVARAIVAVDPPSGSGEPEARKGGLSPGRMRMLEQRIAADAPPPHLAELAELCGMTVRQLGRAYKQETGVTLGRHVDAITMERARRLLTQGDLPIARIAQMLGFANVASFSYAFRRSSGVRPGDFRRRSGQG